MRGRWLVWIAVTAAVVTTAGYAAFQFSPWPSVLLIRHAFAKDAERRNAALETHDPGGVAVLSGQRYGERSRELVDIYFPAGSAKPLPTVIWIHGGAFIAGDRKDLSGYLKMLVSRGYTAVAIGYPLAPGARYPEPVIAANAAVSFLLAKAELYNIDTRRLFIVGDSAGAQIAAQLTAGTADPAYGRAVGFEPALHVSQIRGAVLFCGIYDASAVSVEGPFGGFIRTVLWSYFGSPDVAGDPDVAQFSVASHVNAAFPPTLISVGNADPLAPQSVKLAESLQRNGVRVDTLFFQPDHQPPLQHEYQFDLDGEAGKQAFATIEAFLAANAK